MNRILKMAGILWPFFYGLPGCMLLPAAQGQQLKFDFGAGDPAGEYRNVTPATMYNEQAGYGFEPGAALNAGGTAGSVDAGNDYITSGSPFYFSVKLPEGNYIRSRIKKKH